MCLTADLSTVPKHLQSWRLFWACPDAHALWRKSSEWIRAWQQRRRCTPEVLNGGGSGGGGPCPGAAHFTQPPRIPWSCRFGARDESERRSDDSSRGILELAAARKGTSPSPPWSFPNFAQGHRDGRRSPRRGQNRRIRTPARDVVSDTLVCSEGQVATIWHGVGRCSDYLTPTPDSTSVGCPSRPQQSSHGTGKQLQERAL